MFFTTHTKKMFGIFPLRPIFGPTELVYLEGSWQHWSAYEIYSREKETVSGDIRIVLYQEHKHIEQHWGTHGTIPQWITFYTVNILTTITARNTQQIFKDELYIFFRFCYTSATACILYQKSNSWTYNFVEVSGHNLESSEFSDLRFPYTMFTLQTSFKTLLLKRGRE